MWVLFGLNSSEFLELHNETCVTLANLPRSIIKNRIENWMFPNLVMIIGSACLLISQLNA